MLCLLVKKRLKRRNLREKLHLCKSFTAHYDFYNTAYGEIRIFKIHYFKNIEKAEHNLRSIVSSPLYTCTATTPSEYIEKASIYSLIRDLKNRPRSTVCICINGIKEKEMCEICRFARTVYFVGKALPSYTQELYRLCGVAPVLVSLPVAADFYLDKNTLLNINLPEELKEICPEEFTPTLFAGLIYKENGRLII